MVFQQRSSVFLFSLNPHTTRAFRLTHFRVASSRRAVRSVAVDHGNEWFVTGSADRTIKIWDLASGQLRLTLTGHIEQVGRCGIRLRGVGQYSKKDSRVTEQVGREHPDELHNAL